MAEKPKRKGASWKGECCLVIECPPSPERLLEIFGTRKGERSEPEAKPTPEALALQKAFAPAVSKTKH